MRHIERARHSNDPGALKEISDRIIHVKRVENGYTRSAQCPILHFTRSGHTSYPIKITMGMQRATGFPIRFHW